MDTEEPFNPDYYQHVLSSLTVNSRALITELTSLADKYVDEAETIVNLIEERIRKCLPQYKLFAMYLVDSICKNIGNPYNLIFGSKLYTIFTSTYLVVTDTPTRQNLINLFKTWTNAQTSSGLELFPQLIIKKIEQFIIKATSINSQNGGPPIANGAPAGAPSNGMIPNRITQDMLLREGNYLLQYLIALDDELDRIDIPLDDEQQTFIKSSRRARNELILSINNVSEAVMTGAKPDFEQKAPHYQTELQNIRKNIDDQSFQQKAFIKPLIPKMMEQKELQNHQLHPGHDIASPTSSVSNNDDHMSLASPSHSLASSTPSSASDGSPQSDKVEINLVPNTRFLGDILLDITADDEFKSVLLSWGKTPVPEEKNDSTTIAAGGQNLGPPIQTIRSRPALSLDIPDSNTTEDAVDVLVDDETQADTGSIASSLGLSFNSLNFSGSFLGSPKNELTPVAMNDTLNDDDDDLDSYDPEHSVVSQSNPSTSTTIASSTTYPSGFTTPLQSSMKRPRFDDEEPRVPKRVRFVDS